MIDDEVDSYIFSITLNNITGISIDEAHDIWYTLPLSWRIYPRFAAIRYSPLVKKNDSEPDTL